MVHSKLIVRSVHDTDDNTGTERLNDWPQGCDNLENEEKNKNENKKPNNNNNMED